MTINYTYPVNYDYPVYFRVEKEVTPTCVYVKVYQDHMDGFEDVTRQVVEQLTLKGMVGHFAIVNDCAYLLAPNAPEAEIARQVRHTLRYCATMMCQHKAPTVMVVPPDALVESDPDASPLW